MSQQFSRYVRRSGIGCDRPQGWPFDYRLDALDLGLVATVVGAGAGMAAVGVGFWQGWLVVAEHRRQRRAEREATGVMALATPGASLAAPLGRLPAAVRGRESLLRSLRLRLKTGGLVVLAGPGGVGKSTIATEFVRQAQSGRRGLYTWWVSGVSSSSLSAGLVSAARQLGASPTEIGAIGEQTPDGPDCLWRLLEHTRKRWLLVIDNADDPDLLAAPVIPPAKGEKVVIPTMAEGTGWARSSRRGVVLITSRRRSPALWGAVADVKRVGYLPDQESGQVLRDLAPGGGSREDAEALGRRLGGLALALHLAGSYLSSEYARWRTFEAYRQALDREPHSALSAGVDAEADDRTTVTRTWELSLDDLARHGLTQTRALLRLLSCYAPALPIPPELLDPQFLSTLLLVPDGNGGQSAAGSLELGLRGLNSVGLIETVSLAGIDAPVVHPVIAATNRTHVLRSEPSDPNPTLVRQAVVVLITHALGALSADEPQDWPRYRLLAPHLQAVLDFVGAELDDEHLASLFQVARPAALAYERMGAQATDTLPSVAPLPPGSRMGFARNPGFVGRSQELVRIASALWDRDARALRQVVAVTGLGGVGKTTLAVEFVHRYGRFFSGGVFWFNFASSEEISSQIAACAGPDRMGLETGVEGLSPEETLELVMRAWQSELRRLLVFDNCEDAALLEAWRPTSGGCRVLVTSRRANWSPTVGVSTVALGVTSRQASIELLRLHLPDVGSGDARLDALARELGDLPLALHLAGSYLRKYRSEVSLDDYLTLIRRHPVRDHSPPSSTRQVDTLAQTLALSLRLLDKTTEVDREAIALLARMACLAPGVWVPRDLLDKTLEEVHTLTRADGTKRLTGLGLIEEHEGRLRMHPLVARFVGQEDLDAYAQPAVDRALIKYGEAARTGHLSGATLAAVIPHLVEVASAAVHDADKELRALDLCTAAGRALEGALDLGAARSWYEQALAIAERVHGPDHVDTAKSLSSLASVLQDQGECAAARPLYQRALASFERILGPEHPDTATARNNLASLSQ